MILNLSISEWASLFSIVAVLIAIIAMLLESRRARLSIKTDILLRLDDKLHSTEYKLLRRIAAQKLLIDEKPNLELEGILELLSTIAFFYVRRAIDTDLTYKQFSYWLDRYWLAGKLYVIEESRRYDPQSYQTLERVATKFIRREIRSGYPLFSEEVLKAFLEEERQLPISEKILKTFLEDENSIIAKK
jgi:hypothetical protein